jgi:radical SAM protein with 4Fe4S-binding SPASM domain
VIRGWNCLKKHKVDANILCTIHAANADHPLEVYRFFRDELKAEYIQLIPIVERATPETIALANQGWGGLRGADRPLYTQTGNLVTERSVKADKFGKFLIAIFDEWVKRDVGRVFVVTFDVALGSWLGQHNSCIVSPTCGASLVMEHNGDVYSCDHYVEPDHRLGNVRQTPLGDLVLSEKQQRFGQAKYDTLPQYCRKCPVLFACYGECPRNRFIRTPDGEEGLNYLCEGYKAFFQHIDGPMRTMGDLISASVVLSWTICSLICLATGRNLSNGVLVSPYAQGNDETVTGPGRDAVCASQAHPQARPIAPPWPKRGERRVPIGGHCPKPAETGCSSPSHAGLRHMRRSGQLCLADNRPP